MRSHNTIRQAAAALRQGHVTPQGLLADCLARVDLHDSRVHAWVLVDRAGALSQAEVAAGELAAGLDRGPLHGIPVGIKDIVDVSGLPTRAGSPLTDPQPAKRDASVVAALRRAGAVVLGKTVTTEFACFDPSPTRNPWNVDHTPGGSSSGSAAAPALGMCWAAIGSQTGGSITRPASYCGVAGIKPTFGRTSRAGVVPVSFHLDHVGAMARTVDDCALLLHAIAGPDPRDPACAVRPNFELLAESHRPPRLGVVRSYFLERADPEVAEVTQRAIEALQGQGATLVELALPEEFAQAHAMHRRLYFSEAAEYHRATFGAPRGGYGPRMAELLAEGFSISMADYQEALRQQVAFQNAMARILAGVDALVTPATVTAAPPLSEQTTGDPSFNAPWSFAGVPTVSVPAALTTAGLPVSLQLVGEAWSEGRLLAVGQWCEVRLGFASRPAMLDA